MSSINDKIVRALGPALIATIGVMVMAVTLDVVVKLADVAPRVGDIVAFTPSATVPDDDDTRLFVSRQDQTSCVLDPNVLRRSGGSLVVETQIGAEASSFVTHWAGARTSDGPEDCGSNVNLIVDRLDLNALSQSADHNRIDPKFVPLFAGGFVN
jgi:hypothetical protein